MLPSLSGSDFHSRSYVFKIDDISQVGEVRRFALAMCHTFDFSEVRQGKINLIITELGNNLIKYALGGVLVLRNFSCGDMVGIEVLSIDKGHGFSDIGQVMVDGYSTGTTPGTGLGAIKRLSDVFEIYSQLGVGTVVLSHVYTRELDRKSIKEEFIYGAVNVPMGHEQVCGDGWALKQDAEGFTAIMLDGLGHGVLAFEAAQLGLRKFVERSHIPLDSLLKEIHEYLRLSRGAAVFLVRYTPGKLDFVGAGNIRCFLQEESKSKTLISQNGTAGLQIRTTKVLSEPWDGTGLLVMHSDGLTSHWNFAGYPGLHTHHPALASALAYRDFNRSSDDSTVLVVRRRI